MTIVSVISIAFAFICCVACLISAFKARKTNNTEAFKGWLVSSILFLAIFFREIRVFLV